MSRRFVEPAPRDQSLTIGMTDREAIEELTAAIAASVFWRARVRALLAVITTESACGDSPSKAVAHSGHQ